MSLGIWGVLKLGEVADWWREDAGRESSRLSDSSSPLQRCHKQKGREHKHRHTEKVRLRCSQQVRLLRLMRRHQSLSGPLSQWAFVCTFDIQSQTRTQGQLPGGWRSLLPLGLLPTYPASYEQLSLQQGWKVYCRKDQNDKTQGLLVVIFFTWILNHNPSNTHRKLIYLDLNGNLQH